MNPHIPEGLNRRAFIAASGALVLTVCAPAAWSDKAFADVSDERPPFSPDQLDSWISIDKSGDVTCFFGKIDVAQGLNVAVAQIVADELDVAYDRIKVVMGHTATTLDHGGATSDSGVHEGGALMRITAAEARMLLLAAAGKQLGVDPSGLKVTDGVVSAITDPSKKISYAALVGGRYFNAPLHWNKRFGSRLEVSGTAKPKDPSLYTIVGKPLPRTDLPPKVYGKFQYVGDVRLPGMMHGRTIRPAVAGAVPTAVDESSIKDIGGARVVWIKDFIGVVADKEWDAVRAAEKLKVSWSEVKPPFPKQEQLHDHIRAAKVVKQTIQINEGAVDQIFSDAAKNGLRVIEAEYEWPFQSHACLGPACAVVDVKPNHVTIYTGSQKPYEARYGIAELLNRDQKDVTSIWVAGTGSYGRNDAGDCAADAAILSNAVGRPVRVQYSRAEGLAWDPKGSASIHRVKAAVDDKGKVVAFDFMTKGFSLRDMPPFEGKAANTLAGHLLGHKPEPIQAFGIPIDSYGFEHKRVGWETIPPLLDRASPLRTAHLRATASPMCHFASEQFIDELAVFVGADPVEFRLAYMTDPRDRDVVQQTAERFGWDRRSGPRRARPDQEIMIGRGMGAAQKEGTSVAVFVEVEVTRSTGRVRPLRYAVGHDCGLIINPRGLRQVIECQTIWATSRTLFEEVKFDERMVTSSDWDSYPTTNMDSVPATIDVVLINRPNVEASGAGENAARAVTSAVANAFFDATGVRLRKAPLSPERVKAAFAQM